MQNFVQANCIMPFKRRNTKWLFHFFVDFEKFLRIQGIWIFAEFTQVSNQWVILWLTIWRTHSDYGEKETLKNIVIQNHSIEKAKSPIETGQANAHAVNGGWPIREPSAGKSSFKPSSISSFHETSSVAFDSRETIDYPNEPSIWSKNDSRGPVSKNKNFRSGNCT